MYSLKYKLMSFLSSMKIRHKILLLNILILLVPIILLAMGSIEYYQTIQIKEQIDSVESELNEASTHLINSTEICNMAMQTILLNSEVEKFVDQLMEDTELSIHQIIKFNNTEVKAIERLVNTNPYIHSIRFYLDKEILELAPVIYRASRFDKQELIKEAEMGMWYFGEVDNISAIQKVATYQEPLGTLISPYLDIKRQQIGIVEVAIPMKMMFPLMYETTEEEVMYFVDKQHRIYQDQQSEIKKWQLDEEIILQLIDDEEAIKVTELGHEQVVVGYKSIKNIGGYIIKIHSLEKVFKQMDFLRVMVTFGVAFLVLLITLLINKSTHIVFKNFYKVLDAIQEIQKGNLDIKIDDFGKGEIGNLGRNIQTMARSIKELMEDKVNRQTLIKDSEIRALQNQINAHFIYNVLESIKMMAEIEGSFDISDAITCLGNLLRYSMKWKSPTIKVKDEINYIEDYIALLNLRYDYKIILNIMLPERILEQVIPKMCIQPIVENAIKHGIEELAEDTIILIKGKMLENYFLIEVTDSGIGMNEEQVEKLRMKIRGELVEEKQSSNGIGLKNVQDRIALCFGSEYGLEVVSKERCFTKIIIKIPYSN